MINWGFRGVSIPSVVYIALIKRELVCNAVVYVRFFMYTSKN